MRAPRSRSTGETAAPSQSGYVLQPWQSTSIEGWRKSLDRVAAFRFTRLANSYAARTGRPDDVGVIGVAVFRELERDAPLAGAPAPPTYEERAREATADSAAAVPRRLRAGSVTATKRAGPSRIRPCGPAAQGEASRRRVPGASPAPRSGA